jgi:hypothetical protein
MVEEDIEILDELARNRNVTAVSADEITKAIKSINKGKSADFHGITIVSVPFFLLFRTNLWNSFMSLVLVSIMSSFSLFLCFACSMRIVFLKCLFVFFFSCKCRFSGNDYKGEENVVKAFQDHFRK